MEEGLERFVAAQDAGGAHGQALAELRAARKRTHWIWYVLPQVEGLGRSAKSRRYGVKGLEEARDYLAHPVLGRRLLECADALLDVDSRDPGAVMGEDAVKLHSSMTLFLHAAEGAAREPFREVLERYFGGAEDGATVARLSG